MCIRDSCKGYFACQLEGVFRLDENPGIRQREDCDPRKDYLYDFTPNGVDLERFPFNIWRKINRQVLSEEHTDLFLLGDPQGEAGLREAIARYLHQARGVNCTPEQIVIGAGNDYLPVSYTHLDVYKRQVESLRRHYVKTLLCWRDNFEKHREEIADCLLYTSRCV